MNRKFQTRSFAIHIFIGVQKLTFFIFQNRTTRSTKHNVSNRNKIFLLLITNNCKTNQNTSIKYLSIPIQNSRFLYRHLHITHVYEYYIQNYFVIVRNGMSHDSFQSRNGIELENLPLQFFFYTFTTFLTLFYANQS